MALKNRKKEEELSTEGQLTVIRNKTTEPQRTGLFVMFGTCYVVCQAEYAKTLVEDFPDIYEVVPNAGEIVTLKNREHKNKRTEFVNIPYFQETDEDAE